MIVGLGLDILSRRRFAALFARHGERLAHRLLHQSEFNQYRELTGDSAREHFLARSFCAKEAVAKALGTGFGAGVGWVDIRILRRPGRSPRVELGNSASEWSRRRGGDQVMLSFSDERDMLAAVALLQAAVGNV